MYVPEGLFQQLPECWSSLYKNFMAFAHICLYSFQIISRVSITSLKYEFCITVLMLCCLGKKVKENSLCFQYMQDFFRGEGCPNHACGSPENRRLNIYSIFYIFNIYIILYTIHMQLHKWNHRGVAIYPKGFQDNRLECIGGRQQVDAYIWGREQIKPTLNSCIEVGWLHMTVTLCWGESNIKRWIFYIESKESA